MTSATVPHRLSSDRFPVPQTDLQPLAGNTARPVPHADGRRISGLELRGRRRWKEPVRYRSDTVTSASLATAASCQDSFQFL